MGDASSPLKKAMRLAEAMLAERVPRSSGWDWIERGMMKAVADEWGLLYPHPDIVKKADAICLAWEARQRTTGPFHDTYDEVPATIEVGLDRWGASVWENLGRSCLEVADAARRSGGAS